ncbi:MAG TPA: hypothetical protein VL282_10610, partial [Tepidisphaeraceae bacterium]|nr:hypothetical protein [Tepidisphaeraceae bacterium]
FFAVEQTVAAMRLRSLIDHGTPITAYVDDMSRGSWFILRYDVDGKTYRTGQVPMMLKRQELLQRQQSVPIKVDRDDPNLWTDRNRDELEPIHRELVAAIVLLPLLAFTILMMIVKRRQVLSVWRDAPLMRAVVVETKQSSLAPLSRVVRFTIDSDANTRIWSTVMPAKAGVPAKDEVIDVICPPSRPDRAIVAKLYSE